MTASPGFQIRLGLGLCLAALVAVLVIALVPDPLLRRQNYVTQFEDVAGVRRGTEVYFRGARLGEVSRITLDAPTQRFTVELSISRRWRPGDCAQVSVGAANPLTPARLGLASLDAAAVRAAGGCGAARLAAGCEVLPLRAGIGDRPLTACRRSPDLVQTVSGALVEAAQLARTANVLAGNLQGIVQGKNGGKGGAGAVMGDVSGTLAAIRGVSAQMERNLRPGQGDLAVTLGNLRRASDRAASVDIASANFTLQEARRLVTENQSSIGQLLASSAGTASQARATLEATSSALVRASASLERMSANLDTLSQRMAADPSSVVRGQRYADPPPPGELP